MGEILNGFGRGSIGGNTHGYPCVIRERELPEPSLRFGLAWAIIGRARLLSPDCVSSGGDSVLEVKSVSPL